MEKYTNKFKSKFENVKKSEATQELLEESKELTNNILNICQNIYQKTVEGYHSFKNLSSNFIQTQSNNRQRRKKIKKEAHFINVNELQSETLEGVDERYEETLIPQTSLEKPEKIESNRRKGNTRAATTVKKQKTFHKESNLKRKEDIRLENPKKIIIPPEKDEILIQEKQKQEKLRQEREMKYKKTPQGEPYIPLKMKMDLYLSLYTKKMLTIRRDYKDGTVYLGRVKVSEINKEAGYFKIRYYDEISGNFMSVYDMKVLEIPRKFQFKNLGRLWDIVPYEEYLYDMKKQQRNSMYIFDDEK